MKTYRGLEQVIDDPVKFSRHVLRQDLWTAQEDILRAVTKNLRVVIKACHGSSKTFTAAIALVWFITRYRDGVAITASARFEQVEKVIWAEIHKAVAGSRYRYPKPSLTELKLGPGNYGMGWSTNDSVRFQGIHASHLLIILDEAPGIAADIWEAVEGARAGGDVHLLVLGNPTITSGPFYDAFTEKRSAWTTFTIDAFDTPNLEGFSIDLLRSLPPNLPEDDVIFAYKPRPYLVTRRWVYEAYWQWGEQSPLWQARVRGQFPAQAEDALISLAWLEAARAEEPEDVGDRVIAGIDVAGPGEDETVATIRCNNSIVAQRWWSSPDPRGEVVAFLRTWKTRLEAVRVDAIGIGYNFGLHLRDLGFPVELVNVGGSASNAERFANRKAEYCWGLRERFRKGEIRGLRDERTLSQLATIRYRTNPRGQVIIESKDELRRRGVRSPDRADSVVLAFAQDDNSSFERAKQQVVALAAYYGKKQELSNVSWQAIVRDNLAIDAYNRGIEEAEGHRKQ